MWTADQTDTASWQPAQVIDPPTYGSNVDDVEKNANFTFHGVIRQESPRANVESARACDFLSSEPLFVTDLLIFCKNLAAKLKVFRLFYGSIFFSLLAAPEALFARFGRKFARAER